MESLSKDDNALSSFPNVMFWQLSYSINCLRLFEKFVEANFGHVLSSNYEEVISQFGFFFTTIMLTFHISMSPKVHIVFHHIPQLVRMTQMPLGLFQKKLLRSSTGVFISVMA